LRRRRIDLGILHHDYADRSIDIDRVVVAGKLAVEIKHPAGTRGSDYGDGGALIRPRRGMVGRIGSAAVRSEAREIDDAGAAPANVDAGHGGRSGGSAAGAAGAGRGRDSGTDILIGIGAYTGSSLARAWARCIQPATGTVAVTDACTSAGSAEARLVSTGG